MHHRHTPTSRHHHPAGHQTAGHPTSPASTTDITIYTDITNQPHPRTDPTEGHHREHHPTPAHRRDLHLDRPGRRCADGNGTLTPLFFSDHVLDIARAKAICAKCALARRASRTRSIARSPGVSGAANCSPMGRIVAHKRPGGRPPKRPRPPVIVDEFGVVEASDVESLDVDQDDSESPLIAV